MAAASIAELRAALSVFGDAERQHSYEEAAAADPTAAGKALEHCATSISILVINGKAPAWSSAEGEQLRTRFCAAALATGIAMASR